MALPPHTITREDMKHLSLPKILSGANAFEINDIQEDETEASVVRRSECNKVKLGRKTLNGIFGKHNSEPIQPELAAWPVCSRATSFFCQRE